jgi:hypothetical protein
MPGSRVTTILCAADPQGSGEAIERMVAEAEDRDVDAIAMVGGLGAGSGAEDFRSIFRALAHRRRPAYWVPGAADAPVGDYLREAHNIEVVAPMLRGVHGTMALTPDGHMLVAGHGGEISDDPDAPREELEALRYPRWEPEYRLKLLRDFDEHQIVLLFSTPPAHRDQGHEGSDAVAELIGTYRPRLAVCGGERRSELIGRTLVVAPGPLADGAFAIVDLHAHRAEMLELSARNA